VTFQRRWFRKQIHRKHRRQHKRRTNKTKNKFYFELLIVLLQFCTSLVRICETSYFFMDNFYYSKSIWLVCPIKLIKYSNSSTEYQLYHKIVAPLYEQNMYLR
jgi:hypothetical protein